MRQKTWNFLLSQYSVPSFGGYIAKERAGIGMAGLDLFKEKKYNKKRERGGKMFLVLNMES